MICRNCGWTGGIEELEPQVGDEFGNELCPACGGMDVIPCEEDVEEKQSIRITEQDVSL